MGNCQVRLNVRNRQVIFDFGISYKLIGQNQIEIPEVIDQTQQEPNEVTQQAEATEGGEHVTSEEDLIRVNGEKEQRLHIFQQVTVIWDPENIATIHHLTEANFTDFVIPRLSSRFAFVDVVNRPTGRSIILVAREEGNERQIKLFRHSTTGKIQIRNTAAAQEVASILASLARD